MIPVAKNLCIALMILPAGVMAQDTTTSSQTVAESNARTQIEELERLGLPYLALQAAQQHPTAISAAKMRQLDADYAAELTRLAVVTTRQESERYQIADRALKIYDRLIAQWQPLGEPAAQQLERVRIDRLEALRARNLMREVIVDYEGLRRDGIPVPNYALAHVAAAYLYLRRPEQARDLYLRVLHPATATPVNPEARVQNQIELFYAMVEAEQHDQAKEVIDAALNEQPVWLRIKGNPQRQPNPLHLDVQHAEALSHLYADDPERAEELLSNMVSKAPNNAGLRTSLAAVYRSRGWPLKAREELKMAESMDPRAITVEAEQAQMNMDLGHWKDAEILLDDLK